MTWAVWIVGNHHSSERYFSAHALDWSKCAGKVWPSTNWRIMCQTDMYVFGQINFKSGLSLVKSPFFDFKSGHFLVNLTILETSSWSISSFFMVQSTFQKRSLVQSNMRSNVWWCLILEVHDHQPIFMGFDSSTVDGRWNQTLAVLLLPRHPQISMLLLGCALATGGQKNQTLTQRKLCRASYNIEIWGLGLYLVGLCGVWFFCPSTVVLGKSHYNPL